MTRKGKGKTVFDVGEVTFEFSRAEVDRRELLAVIGLLRQLAEAVGELQCSKLSVRAHDAYQAADDWLTAYDAEAKHTDHDGE